MSIDDEIRKVVQDEVRQALGQIAQRGMPGEGGVAATQTTAVATPSIVRVCLQGPGPVRISMTFEIDEGSNYTSEGEGGGSKVVEAGKGGTGGERAPRVRFYELGG